MIYDPQKLMELNEGIIKVVDEHGVMQPRYRTNLNSMAFSKVSYDPKQCPGNINELHI